MKEQETEAEILGKLNIEKGKAEALKEVEEELYKQFKLCNGSCPTVIGILNKLKKMKEQTQKQEVEK